MEYLFEVMVNIVGAPGGFGCYVVFEAEKSYWCKMMWWNQYRTQPPGDFALWKHRKTWTTNVHVHQHIIEQLCIEIDKWKFASESYKDECRRQFKYMDAKP